MFGIHWYDFGNIRYRENQIIEPIRENWKVNDISINLSIDMGRRSTRACFFYWNWLLSKREQNRIHCGEILFVRAAFAALPMLLQVLFCSCTARARLAHSRLSGDEKLSMFFLTVREDKTRRRTGATRSSNVQIFSCHTRSARVRGLN